MFEVNNNLTAKVVKVFDKQIIEIENFYCNPDEVRNYAIKSKKYSKKDNQDLLAYSIGRRVCEDTLELGYKLKDVFFQLCNHQEWHIKFDQKHHDYCWSGMRFIVNVTNNKEIIDDGRDMIAHIDGSFYKWACVVYLNLPSECEGGTGFYSIMPDTDTINLEYCSTMKYNKAVLYDPNMIHGAIMKKNMFKSCDRLVQVIFM
jgi:hypothetical protein